MYWCSSSIFQMGVIPKKVNNAIFSESLLVPGTTREYLAVKLNLIFTPLTSAILKRLISRAFFCLFLGNEFIDKTVLGVYNVM